MNTLHKKIKDAAFWGEGFCIQCRTSTEVVEPAGEGEHEGHPVLPALTLLSFIEDVEAEDEEWEGEEEMG